MEVTEPLRFFTLIGMDRDDAAAGWIRRLDELDGTMADEAGGKGASLGELLRAGMRVPGGFVVTRGAFDRFMRAADPDGAIADTVGRVGTRALPVDRAAEEIRARIGGAPVPEPVVDALGAAVRALGADRVSVRSSATCEDGATSAWAGQLDTYLDVDPDHIVDRLRDCWLSIFGASALAYGAANGYGVGAFGVAVVVQQMIRSEVSGIGFSVHPVTQEPDVRLIEACIGLGEAIVSGQIDPDQYVIERGGTGIAEEQVGNQTKALFCDAEGAPPSWHELGERGRARKLATDQVIEYSRMLDRIEDHYGHPVDTEWALADDRFHVLQARPITTLAAEYRAAIVDSTVPWAPMVRRPMPLVEASILAHWTDARHAGKDLGILIEEFMSIQGADDIANHFVSEEAFDAGLAWIVDLDGKNRERLLASFDRAREIYEQGRRLVDAGAPPFRTLEDATEYFIRIGEYTTTLPAWTLIAFEKHGVVDPEIQARAEELRARSLYPYIERYFVEPLVVAAAREAGFSTPERAPEVVTWAELRRGTMDLRTMEERREEVLAGRRFVFELLGDDERVQFVSETEYLLMRLARARRIEPVADSGVLRGQAAWPGVVRGRARVVLSPTAEGVAFDDGDVLVSIQSSPALMPLLERSAAIVTDDGGVACHAAIVCRELKIPTVIGTGRATSTIRDGDLVEVDATAEVVRVLQRAE